MDTDNYRLKGMSQKERNIVDKLAQIGKLVIKPDFLTQEFGYTKIQANVVLSRLYQKGWLQRLRPGIYRLLPLGSDTGNSPPEDAWAIAMELFAPCYISGWTAAEHWDLTEQIFNSTVVFSSQKYRKKDQVIAGLVYRIKYISQANIFGTKKIWSSNVPVEIADIHKTIIDILDDPEIGGGARHSIEIFKSYLQHKDFSYEALEEYAEKLAHGGVYKRLGFLTEKLSDPPAGFTEKFLSKIKTGIIKFDPHGPNSGPIILKWGIRINIPWEDIT